MNGVWVFPVQDHNCLCGPCSVLQESLIHDRESVIMQNAGMFNPNLCSAAEE